MRVSVPTPQLGELVCECTPMIRSTPSGKVWSAGPPESPAQIPSVPAVPKSNVSVATEVTVASADLRMPLSWVDDWVRP